MRLWDKNAALEKFMMYLGVFERDNRQRAGIFDKLPVAEVQRICDKLMELQSQSAS